MISARVIGADAVASGFVRDAATVETRSKALERHYRQVLASTAQSLAPKRTGHYASTIRTDDEEVGSDHPAANRLEFGFHGVDSLGRQYDQGPRAHFGPAADSTEAQFHAANEAMVRAL